KLISIVAISAIMLLAFQNCGQPGNLNLADSNSVDPKFSNALEITNPQVPTNNDIASNNDLLNDNNDNNDIEDTTPIDENDIEWGFNDIVHEPVCMNIKPSDVLLAVDHIQATSKDK